jgi:N6-adenosine-specific RNA methylase IME4
MPERYRTIVADPPWHYDKFVPSHTPSQGGKSWRIDKPYAMMGLAEIKALPVADLADDAGCRLFMWTTNRYLGAAFGVLKAWGFVYKQTIVWHKTGNPQPLPATIAPNHAEYLLVGEAGRVERTGTWPTSVIAAPKGAHSAKPEVFLDMVERVSPGPYVEMFARRARFGWNYWGNESLGTAELPEVA